MYYFRKIEITILLCGLAGFITCVHILSWNRKHALKRLRTAADRMLSCIWVYVNKLRARCSQRTHTMRICLRCVSVLLRMWPTWHTTPSNSAPWRLWDYENSMRNASMWPFACVHAWPIELGLNFWENTCMGCIVCGSRSVELNDLQRL